MRKQQDKATCISCRHYDDEAQICTHGAGLLREIEMSESLAEAEHGCKEYSEMRFRLAPAGLLQVVLEDFNVIVPEKEVKHIYDRFMEKMIENGYIEENEKVD